MNPALLACALLALLAAADGRDNRRTVTVTRDVVRKVDTDTFTGKIEAIDPAKWTLAVKGHEIIKHRHYKVKSGNPSTNCE